MRAVQPLAALTAAAQVADRFSLVDSFWPHTGRTAHEFTLLGKSMAAPHCKRAQYRLWLHTVIDRASFAHSMSKQTLVYVWLVVCSCSHCMRGTRGETWHARARMYTHTQGAVSAQSSSRLSRVRFLCEAQSQRFLVQCLQLFGRILVGTCLVLSVASLRRLWHWGGGGGLRHDRLHGHRRRWPDARSLYDWTMFSPWQSLADSVSDGFVEPLSPAVVA